MDKEYYTNQTDKDDDLYFAACDVDKYSMQSADAKVSAILSGFVAVGGIAVSTFLSVYSLFKGKNSFIPLYIMGASSVSAITGVVSLSQMFKNNKLRNEMMRRLEEIEKIPVIPDGEKEK